MKKIIHSLSTMSSSQKIATFAIIVLALAVPLTVFVSQKRQEIRQHAAEQAPKITSVGVVRGNQWFLKNTNASGNADSVFTYGAIVPDKAGGGLDGTALAGDWTGKGYKTPGIFKDGVWYLRNSNDTGPADSTVVFGQAGDIPVVGDWTGDGKDKIGVVRQGTWYLRNSVSTGVADATFTFGLPTDVPVVGKWNGGSVSTAGVFRQGTWFLKNTNTTGDADSVFTFGNPGDLPVVGDWSGKGSDSVGVVRSGTWFLKNSNSTGNADTSFAFGNPGDIPVAGVWQQSTPISSPTQVPTQAPTNTPQPQPTAIVPSSTPVPPTPVVSIPIPTISPISNLVPLLEWPMNETAGNTVANTIHSGPLAANPPYDGTAIGAPRPITIQGKTGRWFDSQADIITTRPFSYSTATMSVGIWYYNDRSAQDYYPTLIAQLDPDSPYGRWSWELELQTNPFPLREDAGKLTPVFRTAKSDCLNINTIINPTKRVLLVDSKWHFIVVTLDVPSHQLIMYIDGAKIDDVFNWSSFEPPCLNSYPAVFGGYQHSQFGSGVSSDATIWDKVLTADQVRTLYNQGLPH